MEDFQNNFVDDESLLERVQKQILPRIVANIIAEGNPFETVINRFIQGHTDATNETWGDA